MPVLTGFEMFLLCRQSPTEEKYISDIKSTGNKYKINSVIYLAKITNGNKSETVKKFIFKM